jgi:site-specific DNA-adenine methylase
MNKNHFFIPYFGNKRQEVSKILDFIKHKIDEIEYIVEPFGGTMAFSYYLSTKYPKKFKYIINDNNEYLYKLYIMTKEEREKTKNKLIEINNKVKTKEDYLRETKGWETDFIKWLYANKVYSIRPGLYPQNKKFSESSFDSITNAPISNFIDNEKIIFYNTDAIEIYNHIKNDKKALIFLDPPYLSSENRFYKNPTLNIYEYLYNNDIKNEKAYIILCLANNWIIKLLFLNKKSYIYDKKYETNKKEIKHIIISNE